MELQLLINRIIEKLSILSTEVKLRGTLNLLDINVLSEQVYSNVLNIVYGWNLSNANLVQHNIKAIDLYDDVHKIIAQVSSDNSTTKVQQSLNKIELPRYSGYHFKFVSISKSVKHLKDQVFTVPTGISFSSTDDCYDIFRIIKDIQSKDIDTINKLAEFLEKAVLPSPSIAERRPSVITYVINCLAEADLATAEIDPDVRPFDFTPKIEVNDLKKWKSVVEQFAVFGGLVDSIYDQYDTEGKNKSFTVLMTLNHWYQELAASFSGDELFDLLLKRVYEAVDGDNTCNASLSRDELEMNIKIVLVDAFMKCRIFKKPE